MNCRLLNADLICPWSPRCDALRYSSDHLRKEAWRHQVLLSIPTSFRIIRKLIQQLLCIRSSHSAPCGTSRTRCPYHSPLRQPFVEVDIIVSS